MNQTYIMAIVYYFPMFKNYYKTKNNPKNHPSTEHKQETDFFHIFNI